MERFSWFLVNKRKAIFAFFMVLAVASAVLMTQVNINTDMTKYLPDGSAAKTGVGILTEEFPAGSTFNLMFKNLPEAEKADIAAALAGLPNVQQVQYEAGSVHYNQAEHTLYVVALSVAGGTDEVKAVTDAIKTRYAGYDYVISGDALGNTAMEILPKIAGIAFAILLVILFIMCESWVEPLLFLFNIAIAVLINMGTNAFFDSVSDITMAIAAILQLCLSIDYSIMLLNRYRQEKQQTSNPLEAMQKSLRNAFTAISSSAVTTIVGMLALVFMSFTIGADLGYVLAKGVALSLMCIFTVLPALILMCDKAIEKTAKKTLHFNMKGIAGFGYAMRKAMPILFVLLFAASYFLQGSVNITYTLTEYYEINKTFTVPNPIVVVYENADEEAAARLAEALAEDPAVDSVNAYATTLGKEMTYQELASAMGMDEMLVAQMYALYFGQPEDAAPVTMTFQQFVQFVKNDVANTPAFASMLPEDTAAQLSALGDGDILQMRMTSAEFAQLGGVAQNQVQLIFLMYEAQNGKAEDGKIALGDLVQFVLKNFVGNPQYATMFTDEVIAQLNALENMNDQAFTSGELAAFAGIDEVLMEQLFQYYDIANGNVPNGRIALSAFVQFLVTDVASNEAFAPFFTADTMAQMQDAQAQMDDGKGQMIGAKHSRMILNTYLSEESDETFAFIKQLDEQLKNNVSSTYYIVGSSAIANEMNDSFPGEMNLITILTAVVIFLVVAIAFRSLVIPTILVLIIQCAVFITMGTVYIAGSSMYYLPLLIVQCLLMGATVDYGILFTSYYREARETLDKKEALAAALSNASHAIFTSAFILMAITTVLGIIMRGSEKAISEILLTIAKGDLCATVLIIFILPAITVAFDRFVCKKRKAE